jgi:hypothetical protein
MQQYKVVVYSFNDDPWTDNVPNSYITYLSAYAKQHSYTVEVQHKNQPIFVARLFYLTKQYGRIRGFGAQANFELGDVFLFPSYQGRKDPKLHKKFSQICLELVLATVSNDDTVVLWTTEDNALARKRYEKLGFVYLPDTPQPKKWLHTVFAVESPWIL